jgi:hypothetical protein
MKNTKKVEPMNRKQKLAGIAVVAVGVCLVALLRRPAKTAKADPHEDTVLRPVAVVLVERRPV